MSLSDLAALGSFISGLAVLISLVFLYFQLRQIGQQVAQAERNQQASIQQTTLVQPAVRLAWKQLRSNFGREFVAFFDKSIVELPTATVEDDVQALVRWKTEFAAERAKGSAQQMG